MSKETKETKESKGSTFVQSDVLSKILDNQVKTILEGSKVKDLIAEETPKIPNKDIKEKAIEELAYGVVRYIDELSEQYSEHEKVEILKERKKYLSKEKMINLAIQKIEEQIGDILNKIIHHEKFQKLEASWIGLKNLIFKTDTSEKLKIKVLNVSKDELLQDFSVDLEKPEESDLYKKVYEQEYNMFGGESYGVLIGDYEIDHSTNDMDFLESIAAVAASAHAPFITSASKKLFKLTEDDDFRKLSDKSSIKRIFSNKSKYARWNSFRNSEHSKYVALTLPHVLMRLPYGNDNPIESISSFKEDLSEHNYFLWGNTAYVLGERITNSFSLYGWCAAIRGVEGGGLVEGLPLYTYDIDENTTVQKCPTEMQISDTKEKEFSDLGLIPLVHCKNTDYAAFFGTQSLNIPKKYDTPQANANARLSAQLQYTLCASRFSHYLKSMMRDMIGSFATNDQVAKYLNRWINQYVVLDDDAGQELKAQYPLREARVDVSEIKGKPGCYNAIVYLRPHYQLDELTISMRLVSELPPPAKRG